MPWRAAPLMMHLINKTVGAIVFTIVVWSLPIADIVAS